MHVSFSQISMPEKFNKVSVCMYDLGKKTGHFQRKFGKWVKNIFLYMKFIKKFFWGLSDVLPQFACSVALIGMELLCTLEGYLSSPTCDY